MDFGHCMSRLYTTHGGHGELAVVGTYLMLAAEGVRFRANGCVDLSASGWEEIG